MANDIGRTIERHGGLIATSELHRQGFDRSAIARLVTCGAMARVRQGWYARADVPPPLAQVARIGGRLTCVSQLARAGVWVVSDELIHVAVPAHGCQLRDPDDSHRRLPVGRAAVHWVNRDGGFNRSRLTEDVPTALTDAGHCVTSELLTVAADSALSQGLISPSTLRSIAESQPAETRSALESADGICESGIETILWLRLRHLAPRRQVWISGVGRVDFVFGDRLVVEVDGRAFHEDADHFESDRRRDAALSARGYRVLRFSYHQVMFRWDDVRASVLAAIARGDEF